jgi:hypothetical protein
MKKLLSALLLTFTINLSYSQNNDSLLKNEYYLNINYSFITDGDQSGIHIINEYNRLILPKLKTKVVFGYLYSAKESGILIIDVPSNYNTNIATGNWGFTHEDGIKILELKTDQQTCLHADLLLSYDVFRLGNFKFNFSAGGSIAYISKNFITRWELGTFNGEATGEQNLQLVYPYYSRFIDIGVTADINIVYNISNKISLGAICRINNFSKSGYRFYDLGLKGGIKF